MLDTHYHYKKLVQAGFTSAQAEAILEFYIEAQGIKFVGGNFKYSALSVKNEEE